METIGDATLILADAITVRPSLPAGAAVISDVPYGMNWDTDSGRFSGGFSGRGRREWPRIEGDDRPFDPAPWIEWPEVILWGANHFAQRLPVGATLVWVKRRPANFGKFLSDAEIGWKKGGHGVSCIDLEWSSQGRRSEGFDNLSLHPAQKPVALMAWCIERVKSDTIVDPYMGSGTTALAALNAGRKFVGVELVPEYFDVACRRVERAQRQGVLLAP